MTALLTVQTPTETSAFKASGSIINYGRSEYYLQDFIFI